MLDGNSTIRGIHSYVLPPPHTGYRRFVPLIVLIIVVVGGFVAWTAGTTWLIAYVDQVTGTPTTKPIDTGVRAALVVAWIAVIGLVLSMINICMALAHREPLVVAIPETAYSFLSGATAVSAGLLIGVTVFK
jgi:hypothetical protein